MTKTRLEAFSDGVIAILITIMVLNLHVPHGDTWKAFAPVVPKLLSYTLSFIFLGIYWNNHHHLIHAAEKINGTIMWANLHLMFWLSLVPFGTDWMGETKLSETPTAAYGVVLLACGLAYSILVRALVSHHGPESALVKALRIDRKGNLSLALYVSAIPLAYVQPWISAALYVTVALMWLVPDKRIERKISR